MKGKKKMEIYFIWLLPIVVVYNFENLGIVAFAQYPLKGQSMMKEVLIEKSIKSITGESL